MASKEMLSYDFFGVRKNEPDEEENELLRQWCSFGDEY